MKLSKRLGKFSISADFLTSESERIYDEIRQVMSNVIIVRAEYIFGANSIEYTAMSNSFRELTEGESVPTYIIIMQYEEDGTVHFGELKELSQFTTNIILNKYEKIEINSGDGNSSAESPDGFGTITTS